MEADRRNGRQEEQRYNFGKSGSVGKTLASEIWKAFIDFATVAVRRSGIVSVSASMWEMGLKASRCRQAELSKQLR